MKYYIYRGKNKHCNMQEEGINIEQKNSHKRVNIMLFLFHVVKEQTKLIYDYLWR